MEKREQFSTRLGFVLIAAGCAIGLGNVWRFPYITGQYGGALFVLIYLAFLLLVGLPILTVELAIGRSSRRSLAHAFEVLETPGTRWHLNKFWLIPGSYILMSFYGLLTGWMLFYFWRFISGDTPPGITREMSAQNFVDMLNHPLSMFVCMTTVTVVSFAIVALGVTRGLERITKPMMILLLILLLFMAGRSFWLDGFSEGIGYYLKPDFSKITGETILDVLWAAMGQAFFTLSVGQGSIEIFGTYLKKRNSLLSEASMICALDTLVALLAGFVIFPACFSYGVQPETGSSLVFITLNTVFSNMSGGIFWGALFFLFMLFAAMSTLIAVYESIVAICMELFGLTRRKSVMINLIVIMVLSLPALFGFNYWNDIEPMGEGSCIMDLQDFIISNNVLPLGSLVFMLFIVAKSGFGWQRYIAECNEGAGLKISAGLLWYYRYVLPPLIALLLVVGYVKIFG